MFEPVITLRSVVALIGRFPVLAGADLSVAGGEVVLLTGPNGAGKTSLLRLLAGLLPPTDGEAIVLGWDLRSGAREVRSQVGYLGHESFLYEDLTVEENCRFAVRAARGDRARILPALEALGLDGRLSKVAVFRLSAGQRRRTELAILQAINPPLWLLDEPYAGLDQAGRGVLDGVLRSAATQGRTVVFSSHELANAKDVATRCVEVAGGRTMIAELDLSAGGQVPTHVA